MSAKELQSIIIHKIAAIEDESVLEEIFRLVDRESEINTIYTLTKEEKAAVAYGLNDIKEGKVYSSQVADTMIKEWLKK